MDMDSQQSQHSRGQTAARQAASLAALPVPLGFLHRSLLPLAAVALLGSTLWIGPWGFLVAAVAWWQIVRRIR